MYIKFQLSNYELAEFFTGIEISIEIIRIETTENVRVRTTS